MERQSSRRWRGSYRRRRKKPWAERLADWTRSFIAFLFSNVGIVCLVVGYTIAGAFIFISIEANAAKSKFDPIGTRDETAAQLWDLTFKENIFSEEQWKIEVERMLEKYQKLVVDAVNNDGYKGEIPKLGWTFAGAFLYSLTVITTIGYGNISPRTEWGKVATIIYAIAGMPLFLLYLSNIGDILARSFKWTYARCCLCRCRRKPRRSEPPPPRTNVVPVVARDQWQMVKIHGGVLETSSVDQESSGDDGESEDDSESSYDPQHVTVPLTLCLAIMVGYVCAGALLFAVWEDWDFLEGSYFCFISLSTIGFGDYVPSDQIYSKEGVEFSFVFCSMYLMLGMAMIAMCFNLMQEEVIAKMRTLARTVRHIFRCDR
ncbi:TWiK family of potassium channels protein 18 isoform X2 [Athalia rosae]|uniref:TWiK family of potassium channels protein 18 isoform X2 n=1 Tax=Athalia rosae TaxID=37344 RepID=UPI0020346770|nr:TWiK family of potassium channels protein 18 isoform X2 [Athalia rosae]XP_048505237.1 TWiK family of potassium channels protein 18 isoform X2 [Athalia rosae]